MRVRGWDVAGTVEAVGANVTRFKAGDEVMGTGETGSFAELAVARGQAGAEAGQAHLRAGRGRAGLRRAPRSRPSTTSAKVQRGPEGAGHRRRRAASATLAVQIAKALGAEVTGVCSTAKADLVRSLGADDVIDYTREDFADGRRRWDVIVDTAGPSPAVEAAPRSDSEGNAGDRRRRRRRPLDRWVLPRGAPSTAGLDVRRPAAAADSPRRRTEPTSRQLRKLIEAGDAHAGDRPDVPADRGPRRDPLPRAGPPPGKIVVTT